MADFEVKLLGQKEIMRKLERLPENARRKVIRPAINMALTPIRKAARANLGSMGAVETGLLKQSLGKKVKTYKWSGVVWGAVGIDKRVMGTDAQGNKRWPLKYAHLVELGTEHSAAKPFLSEAGRSQEGYAKGLMARRIMDGIEKEAAKR